jgi:ribose-phosphate pyrophosphokinase
VNEVQREFVPKKRLFLVSGRAHLPLAQEIADALGVELGEPNLSEFANGELHCRFNESVRGTDVFIIQTHSATEHLTINDAVMEQLIMVDAAKRASAKRITVVCPYYGYSRQDRKAEGREPITAKLLADLFQTAGATRIISVDLHSGQIQGFFDGPLDPLTAMPVLVEYMSELGDDLVIVSPDAGRVKVAERYANQLSADLAIVHKRRVRGVKNEVEARDVVGDVDGRVCVLIDDMIDTASTIVAGAELLSEKGATEVHVAATHGVFSGPAIDRLKNAPISKVVVTNTLPLPPEKQIDKIEVLSVAGIIADAIDAVFEDTSVSEIFGGANQS